MPSFRQGDVVRVPFPYTDRDTRQYRPALVVSSGGLGEDASLLWVVMITSAANRPWPGDVPLADSY
jgi:mRNA interferase MazF